MRRSKNLEIYSIHIQVAESEKNAIWNRYNALLVASSFLVGFNNQSVMVSISGSLVCVIWGVVHYDGYKRFVRRMDKISRGFSVRPCVAGGGGKWRRVDDPIFLGSISVIALFFLVHVSLFSSALEVPALPTEEDAASTPNDQFIPYLEIRESPLQYGIDMSAFYMNENC